MGENVSGNFEKQHDTYRKLEMADSNNLHGKPRDDIDEDLLSDNSLQNNKNINKPAKILLDDESQNSLQNSKIPHAQQEQ